MNPNEPQAVDRIFDPGLDVEVVQEPLGFRYGADVIGPCPEYRSLDSIRPSLRDPKCTGPDPVYAIAMDVARREDVPELNQRMLLFGIVAYAKGRLGDEPVRSQGHVHSIAPHCGWSTPELFEIWQGRALIYGQEKSGDDPGRCVAIDAGPGDKVVMPPGWAHFVANADQNSTLVFGAWCDRQYGFEYQQVRAHGGLAWFPIYTDQGDIQWEGNPLYHPSSLQRRSAREYPELGLKASLPIYEHLRHDVDSISWVSDPGRLADLWPRLEP